MKMTQCRNEEMDPLWDFYVDDFDIFFFKNYDESLFINVGSGVENSIEEIAKVIREK